MMLVKCALPLCVLFLCAAGGVPQGVCVDTKCCAVFLQSTAFARSLCQDKAGSLYDVTLWGGVKLQLPHGHFWIKKADTRCRSAVVTSEGVRFEDRTCTDRLDGFICQYTSTCTALLPSEGAHVNYTAEWGFEGQTVFVPGTMAEVRVPDHPPISRHVCMGTEWLRAPWSCEVMKGGCEHECTRPQTCSCPAGQVLHRNNLTCTDDPCATCTGWCENVGGQRECRCRDGFRLGPGGRCVDVDECSEDRTLCSGQGQECQNIEGTYQCMCQEDYDLVDGVCVDAFCFQCEQTCDEVHGKFKCGCMKGFRVDPRDPTKCEEFCSEQECPAKCPGPNQCYCPLGFIKDQRDNGTMCIDINECEMEAQCDHHCRNTWGGFFCECDEGFQLQEEYHCVLLEPLQVLGPLRPTVASIQPTALPPYVKTGSILGITVFALLCAALLYFLLHRLFNYCTKVQFYSLKRDMDIFTLQQVSTETYKRLSHDWQFRNDCHRL